MDSRFNISAPGMVKHGNDVYKAVSRSLIVAVSQDDIKATAYVDSLNYVPRKVSMCSHIYPYLKPTQVGG